MDDALEIGAGDAVVRLFPALGGRIGQIEVADEPLLRGPEAAGLGWGQWGSYPLIPWSNRIPGGRISFEGRELRVPVNWPDGSALHGYGAELGWEVAASDAASAVLTLDITGGHYVLRGRQTFSVDGGALSQTLEVENRGTERVPVGLGIHPWFRSGRVRVPADLMWPGSGPMPEGEPVPVGPDEDLRVARIPPVMDRCYTGLTGTDVDVPGICLSWSGPITQVVVYTGVEGWMCVEPVTMANDGFRMADEGVAGTGIIALAPGESASVAYSFDWSA